MNFKGGEIILTLVFIVYLIIGTKTPISIAKGVNTAIGKFVLLFIVIIFFMYANPVVSVLLLVVIYELIVRSNQYTNTSHQTGLNQVDTKLSYYPNNTLKEIQMTLEQSVVEQMSPLCPTNNKMLIAPYTPMLGDDRNAAPVN